MKWLLLFLSMGLTACEKLDRIYLPPPGAQFAGGNPEDIQVPLEPPHPVQHGTIANPTLAPVTTTSYAFTQTTTFNPVPGFQVENTGQPGYQQYSQALPGYTQNQSQLRSGFDTDAQSGYAPQNPDIQTINIGSPSYDQAGIQPVNNYEGHHLDTPEGNIYIPGLVSQHPGAGSSGEQIIPGQQGFVPSTTATQRINIGNSLPENQYSEIIPQGSLSGQIPHGTYSGQPISVQDIQKPQINQGYLNDFQLNLDGIPSQQPSVVNQNILSPGQGYNSVYSTTPVPGSFASTSAYSSTRQKIRLERPQAVADRNAVIVKYENVISPNGYSYSYDTSNGIHADETATVGDGTRAQGSYSYIGDDGKVYSVVYTADENGFQPRGDHIPTPPPIPEVIKKVIEQATRDKEAGIIDDGSYDENKYGDKQYQGPMRHRHPHTNRVNQLHSNVFDKIQDGRIKPISGITDAEYNKNKPKDGRDNISVGLVKEKLSDKHSSQHLPQADDMADLKKVTSANDDGQGLKNRESSTPEYGVNNFNDFGIQQGKFNSKDSASERGPISSDRVKDNKIQYPESRIRNGEDTDINPQNVDIYDDDVNQSNKNGSTDSFESDQASLNNNFSVISNRKNMKEEPDITRNKYTIDKIPQSGQSFNQGVIDDFVTKKTDIPIVRSDYGQNDDYRQSPDGVTTQQANKNGYYYNSPKTQFDKTEFPTRFKDQDLPSTKRPTLFGNGTTVRPFLTPEVYNQPSFIHNPQSTSRKPFMTSSVTSPKYNPYTDYEDDEDYNDKPISSNKRPNEKTDISSRRNNPSSTSRPQYIIPSGHRTRVTQKETPSHSINNSNTITPGTGFESTTLVPSQDSRFGSTEAPRRLISAQNQRPDDSTKEIQPAYGSRLPSRPRGSSPQYYTTSTYAPVPITAKPTSPDYQIGSRDFVSSEAPGTYQPSFTGADESGYHYGPAQPTTARPQSPTLGSFNSVTYPVSTPGYYQTTYQQHPQTPNRPGTFILSGSKTKAPEFLPSRFNQFESTTPAAQTSPGGYQYGPSGTLYSSTAPPSTVGTTPGSFIPSTTPIFGQNPIVDGFGRPLDIENQPGYLSSDEYPGSQIIREDSSRRPGDLTTGSNILPPGVPSKDKVIPRFGGDQSHSYPEYYQPKVIGEDFSGPKQPQRYDPQTGYHYK